MTWIPIATMLVYSGTFRSPKHGYGHAALFGPNERVVEVCINEETEFK